MSMRPSSMSRNYKEKPCSGQDLHRCYISSEKKHTILWAEARSYFWLLTSLVSARRQHCWHVEHCKMYRHVPKQMSSIELLWHAPSASIKEECNPEQKAKHRPLLAIQEATGRLDGKNNDGWMRKKRDSAKLKNEYFLWYSFTTWKPRFISLHINNMLSSGMSMFSVFGSAYKNNKY